MSTRLTLACLEVVHEGQIIEEGPRERVINDPQRPETRRLLDAVL